MGQPHAWTRRLLAAILVLAGCAKDDAKYIHSVDPVSADARAQLGHVALDVAAPANHPGVPGVPLVPALTVGKAAGGAALASLPVLALPAGCLGEPLCTMATGAVSVATYLLLVPVLTITALAESPPDREEVMQATDSIARVMNETKWDALLRKEIEAAGRENAPFTNDTMAASSHLKLAMEGPFMVTDQFIALPSLTVHGELASGGACLMDRRWRWNGDSDDFIDFGDDGGAAYRKAMEEGIKRVAAAILADIFVATKPREVAYWNEAAFKDGTKPRLAAVPMNYEDSIGSWDKTETKRRTNRAARASCKAGNADPGAGRYLLACIRSSESTMSLARARSRSVASRRRLMASSLRPLVARARISASVAGSMSISWPSISAATVPPSAGSILGLSGATGTLGRRSNALPTSSSAIMTTTAMTAYFSMPAW
jgi:hypothetical protein